MIYVGVDLHQRFCFMTAQDATGAILSQQRVHNDAASLTSYFRRWPAPVRVAVEACSFACAFIERVEPVVEKITLVHPQRVKAIASAKLKNDRVDSKTLADLLRADLLPAAWIPDKTTRGLREQLRLRGLLVKQRTRWKNRLHAVLHQYGLRCPHSDLFGAAGREWLRAQPFSDPSRQTVATALQLITQLDQLVAERDEQFRQAAAQDGQARLLMTIPGVGPYTALLLKAEIGDIRRFAEKRALCSYAGLAPQIHQSADRIHRGGITRCGSHWLRYAMVEAALNATRCSPGARAYVERLARHKPRAVARVALARKLLAAVWALWTYGLAFDEQVFAAM